MSEIFQNILTLIGQQKKALAEAGTTPLNITHFKVGDSNGEYYTPLETQLDLLNTKYTGYFTEGSLSQILVNPVAQNEVLYKCCIPVDVGGFTVRELGLFDASDNLILICKLPAQDKFALESGLYQPLTFTPKIIYTNPLTQAVLTASSQIIATQVFVTEQITQTSEQINGDLSDHITDPNAHESIFAQKANLAGNENQTFFVDDPILPKQAVNKQYLESNKKNYLTYCVNNGNEDANGKPDLIRKVSETEIAFKVGGIYPNMGITFANAKYYVISSIANITTGLTADGTYVFIVEETALTDLGDGTYSAIATAVKVNYTSGTTAIPVFTAGEVSIPNITTNIQNGWTITSSSTNTGGANTWQPWRAVDGIKGVDNNVFQTATVGYGWWKASKDTGTLWVSGIALTTARYSTGDLTQNPYNFTIKDQNDAVIKTVTAQSGWVYQEKRIFMFDAPVQVSTIKIDCTQTNNAAANFALGEVEIFEYFTGGNITEGNIYPLLTSNQNLLVDFNSGTGLAIADDKYGNARTTIGTPAFTTNKFNSNGITGEKYAITSLGNTVWTMEGRFTFDNVATQQALMGTTFSGITAAPLVLILDNGNKRLAFNASSNGSTYDISGTTYGFKTNIAITTEYHIAIEFDGSKYRVLIDGTLDIIITNSNPIYQILTGIIFGLYVDSSSYPLIGKMDDLRVTIGRLRYGVTGTVLGTNYFTPPVNGSLVFENVTTFDGDYHTLTKVPLLPKKRINGAWINRQFLKLGQITKTGGTIGLPLISYAYNGYYEEIKSSAVAFNSVITTFNHCMGTNNAEVHALAVCKAADQGYQIGEEANASTIDSAGHGAYNPIANGKNSCVYNCYAVLALPIKNLTNYFSALNTKWDLKVTARRRF